MLGLHADFFKYNTLCVGGTSGGRGLVDIAQCALLVRFIGLPPRGMASEDDRGTTDGGCQIMDNTDLLDIMDPPSDFHDEKYAAYGRLGDRVVCSLYRD